jgi:hypothetical protein
MTGAIGVKIALQAPRPRRGACSDCNPQRGPCNIELPAPDSVFALSANSNILTVSFSLERG